MLKENKLKGISMQSRKSNSETQSPSIERRILAVVFGISLGWLLSAFALVMIWGAPELADGVPQVFTGVQVFERLVIAAAVSFIVTISISMMIAQTKRDAIIAAIVGALLTSMFIILSNL